MNLKIEGDITVLQSQLLFIEDVLITKALLNKHGTCEFVTYMQAPSSFKIVDYGKDQDTFYGCIVMVTGAAGFVPQKLVEHYTFNKLGSFQIIGKAPGTKKLTLKSEY